MHLAPLLARSALAVVFIASATAKAFDRRGASESAAALGVPAALSDGVATALVGLELLVAVALAFSRTARVGGWLAGGVLLTLSAAVARSLAEGRRPACHCFGARSSRPIGADTLVRNAALIFLAVVVGLAGA